MLKRLVLIGMVCLLAFAGCGGDGDDDPTPSMAPATPDNAVAMRWWNALNPEEMVAALHGDEATEEQAEAAKKMYAELDDTTKALVNAAAEEIYGDGGHASVGDWWETLDCRLMRVAAGDGITADPMSPYCAHYPGSGLATILTDEAKAHVDEVGMALLDRDDPGLFVPFVGRGSHGIGTTLEYRLTNQDGVVDPPVTLEYTGYERYRDRDVLVMEGSNLHTHYYDLETGNFMVLFDENGQINQERVPHYGVYAFPMVEGTVRRWTSQYCVGGGCAPDDESRWEEFTVEECGIDLTVEAGEFTVCRIALTDAEHGLGQEQTWVIWYDPENHLHVRERYSGSWGFEDWQLSDYNLVE